MIPQIYDKDPSSAIGMDESGILWFVQNREEALRDIYPLLGLELNRVAAFPFRVYSGRN
jgi:hypothetical protein